MSTDHATYFPFEQIVPCAHFHQYQLRIWYYLQLKPCGRDILQVTARYIVPNYAVGASERSRRDTNLLSWNSRVSNHGQMNPYFSGRTTSRHVSEKELNEMMREVPTCETSLSKNYQDNAQLLIILCSYTCSEYTNSVCQYN